MAQSVKLLTSTQVMISRFLGSGPALGFVLTIQSLEAASDSVSPSFSAPPLFGLCLCLSKINVKKIFKAIKTYRSIPGTTRINVGFFTAHMFLWVLPRCKFKSLSPASGSVLTAWSLEPVSDSVSPSL